MRVTWKEGSFTGDSEIYVKEASGNGVSLSFSPPIFLYIGTFKWYLEGSFTGNKEGLGKEQLSV